MKRISFFLFLFSLIMVSRQEREISSQDTWKSDDPLKNEDLAETTIELKKLRDNLSSINAAERQQNLNLVLDVLNRLMNRLQLRTTTVKPQRQPSADDELVIDEEISNSQLADVAEVSAQKPSTIIETLMQFLTTRVTTTTSSPLPPGAQSDTVVTSSSSTTTTTTTNSSTTSTSTIQVTFNQTSLTLGDVVRSRRKPVFVYTGKCKTTSTSSNATATAAAARTPIKTPAIYMRKKFV